MRTAALALLLAAPVWADVVVMKRGGAIEGVVTQVTDRHVVLDIGGGTVTFERHLVAEIRYDRDSALQRAKDKIRALRESRDPMDFWKVADWCEQREVSREVRGLINRALELDTEDNRTSAARYLLKLVRDGISEELIRAYVSLFSVETDISPDEAKLLQERGMPLGLVEWLVDRQPKREDTEATEDTEGAEDTEEPTEEAKEEEPKRHDPYRNPEPAPCRYPIVTPLVVTPQLYPTYVPQYYGPYLYYYPYIPYQVLEARPPAGSYR